MRLSRTLARVIASRSSAFRRSCRLIFASTVLLVAGTGAFVLERLLRATTPRPSPEATFNHKHLMKSMMAHAHFAKGPAPANMISGMAQRLKKGAPAPDFTLPMIQSPGQLSRSSLLGRPVVLLFGSFSCQVFCERISELIRLHHAYNDRAAFLFVSVTEARHRIPGLEFVIDAPGPQTLEDRRARIKKAMQLTALTMPGVLDASETAETAYDAYPTRLVAVGADGKIALDFGRGMSLQPGYLEEIEAWLNAQANGAETR